MKPRSLRSLLLVIIAIALSALAHAQSYVGRVPRSGPGEGPPKSDDWTGYYTLAIDTVGFNEKTWLYERGAQHSAALHLVERVRPVLDGKYFEYRVTAEDAEGLAKPYTCVRYYEKLRAEIMQDICEE